MRIRIALLAFAGFVATAACGGSSDASTGPGTTPVTPVTPTVTTAVGVSNNTFTPASIQVSVGQTVTWTWAADAVTHTVTFADGVSSGNKVAGDTFARTFSTLGTFAYRCTIHAGQNGSVLVK